MYPFHLHISQSLNRFYFLCLYLRLFRFENAFLIYDCFLIDSDINSNHYIVIGKPLRSGASLLSAIRHRSFTLRWPYQPVQIKGRLLWFLAPDTGAMPACRLIYRCYRNKSLYSAEIPLNWYSEAVRI